MGEIVVGDGVVEAGDVFEEGEDVRLRSLGPRIATSYPLQEVLLRIMLILAVAQTHQGEIQPRGPVPLLVLQLLFRLVHNNFNEIKKHRRYIL